MIVPIDVQGDYKSVSMEIRTMVELKSIYVVKYFKSWTEETIIESQRSVCTFIQMELLQFNLVKLIDLVKSISQDDDDLEKFKYYLRCKILSQLVECVDHLHSQTPPIIHRDLKPQNVLVCHSIAQGRLLKLCDFGLAKMCQTRVNTGGVGTIRYRAPEVKTGNYDVQSDIYSIGVIAMDIFDITQNTERMRSGSARLIYILNIRK